MGIVPAVVDLEVAERDISDHRIKVSVRKGRILKAFNGDIRFLVELPRDPA